MSLEQDLAALKDKGDRLNTLRIQNATKLKALEAEGEKLVAEAQALGIAPDQVEQVLKTEEAAIQAEVAKLTAELTRILDEVTRI